MGYLEDGCTRDLAFFGVAASKEFRYRWNALGLAVSDWVRADVKDQNPDLTRFVARLYRICLGREFDFGGLTAWVQALVSGYSGAKIVTGFAHSREFAAMTEDDNEYVSRLYEAILGREPDERGLANWLGSLEKGYTRDQVLRGFLRSREFKALCAGYGITAFD